MVKIKIHELNLADLKAGDVDKVAEEMAKSIGGEVPEGLKDALREIAEKVGDGAVVVQDKPKGFTSMDAAVAEAYAIFEHEQPKAGDLVVRTLEGEKAYKFPEGNQAAVVVEAFNGYRLDEEGRPYNGIINVALRPGKSLRLPADLMFYRTIPRTTN